MSVVAIHGYNELFSFDSVPQVLVHCHGGAPITPEGVLGKRTLKLHTKYRAVCDILSHMYEYMLIAGPYKLWRKHAIIYMPIPYREASLDINNQARFCTCL